MTKTKSLFPSKDIIEGVDFASFYLVIQEQAPIMYSEATLDQLGRAYIESDYRSTIAVGKLAWILHTEAELIVETSEEYAYGCDNPVYTCEARISAIFEEAREIIGNTNF